MTTYLPGFYVAFGAVERALARAHKIPPKALPAFRARLGALQKAGVLGAKNMPGKGQALHYGPDEFHRLIFACEMLELGLAPSVIIGLVKSMWTRRLRKIFETAAAALVHHDAGPDDVIMHFGGVHLLGDALADAVPAVNACSLRDLPGNISMWMTMMPDDPAGLPPRAIVINLSMRLRAFHRALAASYLDDLRAEGRAHRKKK
jgi:hypothetical protein